MNILVCTKNITYSCGRHFLNKNRIVARQTATSSYIYRSKKDLECKLDEKVPLWADEFKDYFRDATEKEIEMFNQGIKSI